MQSSPLIRGGGGAGSVLGAVLMAGLLETLAPRNCPHGHGAMELLPGVFALQGVVEMPAPPNAQRLFNPSGQLLPLQARRCAACGHVDLQTYG